ncbi:Uncharacterised protein [Vibrio cholerae]|uniref:Uncharacterized protein n=1 Tax=Vibrio cholerae TaxID=666 RepID=A0A655QWV6_VIBCL|nr:Uncharacterised protein [Vibrio cholerae]CSA73278.1 Uncharacterised protein [Vibrio cholerae]
MFKASNAGFEIKTRTALKPTIKHYANAFDGQRSFSNIGRQDHFAHPRRRGSNCALLRGELHLSIQRADFNLASQIAQLFG